MLCKRHKPPKLTKEQIKEIYDSLETIGFEATKEKYPKEFEVLEANVEYEIIRDIRIKDMILTLCWVVPSITTLASLIIFIVKRLA